MVKKDGDGSVIQWVSGEWAGEDFAAQYRSEWLGDILVERITLVDEYAGSNFPPRGMPVTWGVQVKDLVRFWLPHKDWVIVKAYDVHCGVTGYYVPVISSVEQEGPQVRAQLLFLGLQMDAQRSVTVVGEREFDASVAMGVMNPIDIERAEQGIRELTTATAARLLPPAFVRNFAIIRDTVS